jgi:hypothetical protein
MGFKCSTTLAAAALTLCPPALFGEDGARFLSHPYHTLETASDVSTQAVRQEWRGERLEYDIYWGLMKVGRAYLHVDRLVVVDSQPAYHIISGAKSTTFIKNFYRVDDINESWLDAAGLFSRGYYKKIQEGNYFFNEWVVFDYSTNTFRGEKLNKKRNLSPVAGPLEGRVNDVLSALYLVRTMELTPGNTMAVTVNTKRNWNMTVKFRKRDKEATEYGKFKCVIVEPQLGDDGLFIAKKGRKMLVWITDDALRIPLVLKAEIFIGSVTARLTKRIIIN